MSTSSAAGEPSDVDLVRAFRGGSVEAFDRLFARYHASILGLATRMLRDARLAEDVAQETFFRVLRSLGQVDDEFNFSAWIHRIASNLCLDELRRGKRGQGPRADDGLRAASSFIIEDPDELLVTVASGERDERPDEALAIRELRREVVAVASKLPPNYRRVLNLREITGLSYGGIAQAMGITESAVETLLHRARRRFKQEFRYLTFTQANADDVCETLVELLETVKLTDLRRDQRDRVLQHAETCEACSQLLPG